MSIEEYKELQSAAERPGFMLGIYDNPKKGSVDSRVEDRINQLLATEKLHLDAALAPLTKHYIADRFKAAGYVYIKTVVHGGNEGLVFGHADGSNETTFYLTADTTIDNVISYIARLAYSLGEASAKRSIMQAIGL